MFRPVTTAQTKPLTREEAERMLHRFQDRVARRIEGLSEQEQDALVDEAVREIKDGLNARLAGHPKDLSPVPM